MKNIIKVIIIITIINFIVSPALAADSTPSAEVKTKLKDMQEEIASRAAQIKQDVSKKLQNRIALGFIKSKSDTSLTLAAESGTKMVNVNEYTEYAGKTGKGNLKVTLKNLATEDYIIALGDMDETEVLTAKKIVKTASPSGEVRKFVFGQVVSVGDHTITLQDKQGQKISLKTNKQTTYRFGKNSGSRDDLKIGLPIIASTKFVYIFPYETTPSISPAEKSTTSSSKKK